MSKLLFIGNKRIQPSESPTFGVNRNNIRKITAYTRMIFLKLIQFIFPNSVSVHSLILSDFNASLRSSAPQAELKSDQTR